MKKLLALAASLSLASFAFAQDPAATQPPAEGAATVETVEPAAPPAAEPAAAAAPAEQPAPEAAPAPEPAPAPKFVVFLPEQVDSEWFWYYYSDTAQHIVQSAVEKALVNAGFEVIDIASIKGLADRGSIEQIITPAEAAKQAQANGATYAIVGQATAMKASEGVAYGVNVIRSQAEITVKIIRASDGKVLAVEDASAATGGQSQRVAGQAALKDASKVLSKKIVAAARKVTSDQ